MNEIVKCLRKSERNLNNALDGKKDLKTLRLIKKEFDLQMMAINAYLRGQRILRRQDFKAAEFCESIMGQKATNEDIEAIKVIKVKMKDKIGLLRIKIEKTRASVTQQLEEDRK